MNTTIAHHTGTPVAGRHAAPVTHDGPTIPADSLAFAIGKPGDTNQIRGYWVREDGTSHLELENADGEHFSLGLDLIPTLGAMLRSANNLAAVTR